ncbi:MATE family efflux transporter [Paenibacillus crassostreae]|uniref:Probable multidrug resistance protein NorM n=1 Tax=Paenibacillus crassostreae TaxID=1763538 RepID=A0A167FXA0_9BACL|nr:MATE family efflux transporter [Paenibacillus crassostreae]AOZ93973.1 MATE family efflux transporter [Paenibacillus crassostreae]OAB76992.1 MATE family efflux transporter [Paenibacillus crassostreae]
MKPTTTIADKFKQLLVILLPILITQITLSAITFFDTNMSGKFSSIDLAGVAIGSSLWVPIQVGLTGILLGLTPIVSHLVGNNQRNNIAYHVIQALWLSFILALLVLLIGSFVVPPILEGMNLADNVRHVSFQYLLGISIGIIPLFGYTVLRCLIDALGETRISMIITLISLPINVTLNYALIFGKYGFPQMGGAGAGVASGITYWCIFIIALWFVHRKHPFAKLGIFRKLHFISFRSWKELLNIGVPIGFSIFFETAVFAAVTLLMSQFSTATIAAHQAALNFATTLYMIPLSICMSLTILIGYEKGANRNKDAKQYAIIGISFAVALSLLTAIILIFASKPIASLYSDEAHIIDLIQHFLVYAIFFQISDAIATPTQGALRGYKDVTPAFLIALLAYWIIGLPVGFILANYTNLGPDGYWIGLITGLAIGAILLLRRLMSIQRKFALVTSD